MMHSLRNPVRLCIAALPAVALARMAPAHAVPELMEVQSRTGEGAAPVVVKTLADVPANGGN